jgi:hypothetical protein
LATGEHRDGCAALGQAGSDAPTKATRRTYDNRFHASPPIGGTFDIDVEVIENGS